MEMPLTNRSIWVLQVANIKFRVIENSVTRPGDYFDLVDSTLNFFSDNVHLVCWFAHEFTKHHYQCVTCPSHLHRQDCRCRDRLLLQVNSTLPHYRFINLQSCKSAASLATGFTPCGLGSSDPLIISPSTVVLSPKHWNERPSRMLLSNSTFIYPNASMIWTIGLIGIISRITITVFNFYLWEKYITAAITSCVRNTEIRVIFRLPNQLSKYAAFAVWRCVSNSFKLWNSLIGSTS